MTLIDYFENGTIKDLYKKGAINVNFITYFRYYKVWKAYKEKGHSNNKSYLFAADECGCSESTVRRAIRVLLES